MIFIIGIKIDVLTIFYANTSKIGERNGYPFFFYYSIFHSYFLFKYKVNPFFIRLSLNFFSISSLYFNSR